MTSFDEQGSATAKLHVASSREQATYRWLGDSIVRVLFDSTATSGRFTLVENNSPQPYASPVHIHTVEDEAFIVLEGTIRAWVGDRRYDLEPGDVGLLPHGVPHAFRIVSPTARFYVIALPGGLEQLYSGAGSDIRGPRAEGWAVSLDEVARIETARGNHILRPPPPSDLERLIIER